MVEKILSDDFWTRVQPLLPAHLREGEKNYQRMIGGGRKARYSDRLYLSAILYILRNRISWSKLPSEYFESITYQAVHKKYMQWVRCGFFQRIRQSGLAEHPAMRGITWIFREVSSSSPTAIDPREMETGEKGIKNTDYEFRKIAFWTPVVAPRRLRPTEKLHRGDNRENHEDTALLVDKINF